MAWYDDIRDTATGAGESVLDILGWLDKPQNALQVALYDLVHGKGPMAERTWEGLKSGWQHDIDRTWTDTLGLDRPSREDPWGEWLLRGAAHYGPDFFLDPLLVAGKLGKLGKATEAYKALSEAAHGSPILSKVLPGAPAHLRDVVDLPFRTAERESVQRLGPMREAFLGAKAAEKAAGIGEEGLLPARQLWARTFRQEELPPEVRSQYSKLYEESEGITDEMNRLLENLGLPTVEKIPQTPFYTYDPRIALRGSEISTPIGTGFPQKNLRGLHPEDWHSRLIAMGIDPEKAKQGIFRPVTGPTIPGSPKAPWGAAGPGGVRIVPHPTQPGKWIGEGPDLKQIPLQLEQATLPEIIKAGATGGRKFMHGIAESYLAHSEKAQRHITFLKGALRSIPKFREKGWIYHAHELMGVDPKQLGLRELRIPGMEGQYAKKWLANYLEGKSKRLFDPDTPLGMLEQWGSAALNTRLGRMFIDATNWWKRNVLVHPGFFFGNATSDFGLMGTAMHPYMVLWRKAQGAAVQADFGTPVIQGYTNSQLRKEFMDRGAVFAGQLEAEASDLLQKAYRGKGYVRTAVESLPGSWKKIANPAARFAEGYGRFNDFMLGKIGGAIEGNSRIGVAIHWLKENVDGIPTAQDLDKAVAYADRIMIDYKLFSESEKMVRNIIPFYTWYKGLLGRTADMLLTDPMRLANQGRLLNLTLDPMTGRNKRIADEWVKENAPITGFGGISFDKMAELMGGEPNPTGPRYALAGRFIPWTSAQQVYENPGKMLLQNINPALKAPAELIANYSTFFGMPIDRAAGGAPWNVLNPPLNWLGMENTPYSVASRRPLGISGIPSAWDYMLSQSAAGRTVSEISELGRAAGLWEDPYRAELSPAEGLAWWLTGGKFYPYDRPKFERRRKWEAKEKEMNLKSQLNYAVKKGDAVAYAHYRQQLDEERRRQREMMSFVEG